VKSNFGKLLGLLTIASIMSLSLYFIVDLLQKREITLIYSESSVLKTHANISNIPLAMYLTDSLTDPISAKYYELRVNYWNITYKNPNDTFTTLVANEIPLEPCADIDYFKIQENRDKYFKVANINY
jgi:hypothetical protein